LLEPLGFKIEKTSGIGSSALGFFDGPIRAARDHGGHIAALPLFLLAYPFILLLDYLNPPCPFSRYVLAKKEKMNV